MKTATKKTVKVKVQTPTARLVKRRRSRRQELDQIAAHPPQAAHQKSTHPTSSQKHTCQPYRLEGTTGLQRSLERKPRTWIYPDNAGKGDEHQQPHPPHTAGVSEAEAESEDEAAMEQLELKLTRRMHSVQQVTARRIAVKDTQGKRRQMSKQHESCGKRAREECSGSEEEVLLEQPMQPGARKTHERLKRQREMNGLPDTQLTLSVTHS